MMGESDDGWGCGDAVHLVAASTWFDAVGLEQGAGAILAGPVSSPGVGAAKVKRSRADAEDAGDDAGRPCRCR